MGRYSDVKKTDLKKTEAGEQSALFQWAALLSGRHPELALLFHVPNGGRRDAVTGARLKAQGVKAGVPDICLPVARGGYHGLYIELKADKGSVRDTQKWFLARLSEQGYRVVVCYGAADAQREIELYLGM